MKTLYLVGGAMGVGKTTVCRALKYKLPNSVFLDGDWCWDAHPFQVTEETKAMVMRNICGVLNNFLNCSAYDNVIFCWVMHQQAIIDELLSRLDTGRCRVVSISLACPEQELARRIQADIAAGLRDDGALERGLARLPLYQQMDTRKIDTFGKSPEEVADEIAAL